jgi:DNA-binding transcriptional MerR regulator
VTEIDPAALAIIRGTPDVLRSLLHGLPRELVELPNDEGWSLKDIVAHLHDVETGAMVERIRRMLGEEQPFIRSIDPPARLVAGGYGARPLEELLAELSEQRAEHADWLARLTPDELRREGEHDEVGLIRVIDIAHQWAAHDMAHLRQMALMVQQYLAPKMGATRGFYDV